MADGVCFTPKSFTPESSCTAIERLEAARAAAPAGELCHVALESDGRVQVFEVWDSQESLEGVWKTLVPILTDLGVGPGKPQVARVHDVIRGRDDGQPPGSSRAPR